MKLLIIIVILWAISKVISAASAANRERARQAEIERVRRAQERQRAEQQRIREERRAAQATENERIRQMVALEREQIRQAKEQERLAKEQEKQARLWAEQQKINRAVEERLFKLEQKLELAQREEEHWNDEVTTIRIDMAGLEGYIAYCKSRGLLCKGKEEELRKLSGKLYTAETKAIKARQARELCEKQMAA